MLHAPPPKLPDRPPLPLFVRRLAGSRPLARLALAAAGVVLARLLRRRP